MNILSSPRRISMALGLLRFAKMILGVAVLYLAVKYFGTTYERDSWVLSIFFYGMVIFAVFSPINETFRTRFIHLKSQQSEEDAIQAVNSLISVYWSIFIAIGVIMYLAMDYIVQGIAPGFSAQEQHYLSVMLMWLYPYFICQQITNMQIAVLNTYDSYFYPEFILLIASLVNIACIILLSQYMGIYSMVLATTLNNFIMVFVLGTLLKKKVPALKIWGTANLKAAKYFIIFSVPVYVATFSNQMYQMLEKSVCTNYGEGAVSLFDYARQVMNLPWVVFSSIIPIVMTPILSKCFIEHEEERFCTELRQFTRMLLFISLLVSVVMIVNPAPISVLFFNEINADFVEIMIVMGVTINFTILVLICSQALIAESQVLNYVIGVVCGNLISIALCYWWGVHSHLSLPSVAYALMFGQIFTAIILVALLRLSSKYDFVRDLLKMATILVTDICFLWVIQHFVLAQLFVGGGAIMQIVNISICVALTLGLIIAALFLFNMEEKEVIADIIKTITHKRTQNTINNQKEKEIE